MKKLNVKKLKSSDLIDVEILVEHYKNYLKKELYYSDEEAEIASFDMNDPYTAEFIVQDYEGTFIIDGTEYSIRSCKTDFCRCGLYHLADVTPFEFYMLFDTATMKDKTVGSYMKAEKKFVV